MKRLITMQTMALLVIASCTLNPVDENMPLGGRKVPVSIKAEQIDEGSTKSIRNEDKSVSWMPHDEITVVCGTEKAKFTSTNTENALIASFTGELPQSIVNAINNGTNTNHVWGLYPYDENVESDGTYITTTLPSQQTGVAGTFADDLFITLAKSDDFNLYFYNVCSGFKFSVTKAGITSITIQGKNDEYLAGKVKLSFDSDGKPKVDEVLDGQNVITLTPEKSTFEVGKDYYFVTLPSDFSDGFTVTLNTPSETGVFDVATSLSFPRSKFVTKANVDVSVAYGAKVGNIYIPDSNFKEYCIANFDKDNDEEISYSEALIITTIDVRTDNINSVQGIEYMSNLSSLELTPTLFHGQLSSLDVSNNTSLTKLYCGDNQLTSLDVSNNLSLTSLSCGDNLLTTLDVSNNTALTELYCRSNQLTSLDVSRNLALTTLNCYRNLLTSLDVSRNIALTELDCGRNPLTTLDVSKNLALTNLSCGDSLTTLDVSKNLALTNLFCGGNMTTLDVSKNLSLTRLSCHANLTTLDVSNNTALTWLDCSGNQLTALDVSHNISLLRLYCDSNHLTTLDVSNNTALTRLSCESNQLTNVDVSYNNSLQYFYCGKNYLTTLDVSNNLALLVLDCNDNQLTSLDVSNNLALIELFCSFNPSLSEIWLKTGQTIKDFMYESDITTVYYKD